MRHLRTKLASKSGAPWPENPEVLHLALRAYDCTVLGPGLRAALWVQGCPRRCPGCVAPEAQPFRGGQKVDVATLADELLQLPNIEGLTFSGGEPMAQAAPLVRLVDLVKRKRNLSFICFTGYSLEYLRRRGTAAQKGLVERLDVLIDGPYVASRHTDLYLRGSDNQRVHLLSPRYRHLEQRLQERAHRMQFAYDPEGGLFWMGIPPRGFREKFERKLQEFGVSLALTK